LPDYNSYTMSIRERVLYTVAAAFVIFCAAYVFYRSMAISLVFTPLALLYPAIRKRNIIARRKKELNIQFKDMLYSLSSSLSAGRTVEMAFREVLKDLSVLYPDPATFILMEVRCILARLDMNETLEAALLDFSRRAGLEDVDNFVDAFNICKRTGGNISEVIKNTSSIINDRIEVAQEVDTLLAERRFEQKVMNVLPVLMILLLSASAPDYMSPVFTTVAGRMVMSISIMLLAAAWFISFKINKIKL